MFRSQLVITAEFAYYMYMNIGASQKSLKQQSANIKSPAIRNNVF